MSSTNKTSNYELSQFVGTDKPAWLADYNSDMSKIDAQMKVNANGVASASGSATSATTAIGTLSNLTTTAKTNLVSAINEVDSHADTAQGTANSASQTASANTTKIDGISNYLDISYTTTTPTLSISGGSLDGTRSHVFCASNNTGSLGKVYGRIYLTTSQANATVTFPTPLRPASTLTLDGVAFSQWNDGSDPWASLGQRTITIASNGTATISITDSMANRNWNIIIPACLIFAKSFSDVPLPE